MKTPRALFAAVVALSAAPAVDATGLVDLLTLKDGRVREVRILAVTREGVLYTLPGQTGQISVPVGDVDAIAYYDRPFDLDRGEAALADGRPDDAAGHFREALERIDRGRCRSLHRQEALIGLARAARARGADDAALRWHRELIERVPDTRYKTEAYGEILACAVRVPDREALLRLHEDAAREPGRVGVGALAGIAEAWRLLLDERRAEAAARFDEAAGDADGALRPETHLGRIRCLVELKRPDAVRRACDEAVRAMPGSPDVRALAANTLGDLALAQARGSAETVALKKALMHYLRAVILFGPDAGGPAGEHARALVQAGCCFDRLAGLQADSERRQAFRARARALFKDAAKEVSPSAAPWMERAKAALARDAS